MKEKMSESSDMSEIKPPSVKNEDTTTIDDLVSQVSLLNIIPEMKSKIDYQIEMKSENDAIQISQEEKERKTQFKKEKVHKIESTCTENLENVIEPNSTNVDHIIEQTNNLFLESYDSESDTDDDEESESEEAMTRGPDVSRRNYSHSCTPYSRDAYAPNIYPSLPDNSYLIDTRENNYNFNNFTEKAITDTSRLFLSGGGLFSPDSNDQKFKNDIKELKEFLESPEILDHANNASSAIIDFDVLDDVASIDFSYIDEDEFRNVVENFIVDNSNDDGKLNSIGSYSDVSSPISSCGDQQVLSPSSFYPDSPSTPSLYPSIENSLSPNMSNVNKECFIFTDVIPKTNINCDSPKKIPILPKLAINKINSTVTNPESTKRNRATGPRNVYLSNICKSTKDAYHKKILKLLDEGLLKKSKDGHTFLQTAILDNKPDFAAYFAHMMKLWISKSPKPKALENVRDIEALVNIQDNEGRSALYLSALYNQPNVCGYLFEDCNADIKIADKEGQTPLHIACQRGERYIKIIQIFTKEQSKINLNIQNSSMRTPLHEAVDCHLRQHVLEDETMEEINNLPIVKLLLSSGAKIDVVDKYGFTPIHIAVQNKRIDMLEKLHEYGALCGFDEAINIKNNDSKTALDLAWLDENNPERLLIFGKLLSYGALPSKNL